MPKRLQNQLRFGYTFVTSKNAIFDPKTSPRWLPKISDIFQKSIKIISYDGLWSKLPLGSLQEPAKSLPRAVPEPSRSPSQPSEASCQAPKRTPRACFAIFKSKFAISSVWPKPGPKRSNLIHFSTISGQHLQIRILGPNLQFPRFDQKLVPNDQI